MPSSIFLRFLIASTNRCLSVGSEFSTGKDFYPIMNKLSLFLTFCRYENCAWIPSLLVFVITTGVSGKHFVDTPTEPATAAQIFSFGAVIAGFMISWSVLSSDYTAYFHPRVSRFVEFHGGPHQNLMAKNSAGEFSFTHISASIFLQ
jgi:hypothetical protein